MFKKNQCDISIEKIYTFLVKGRRIRKSSLKNFKKCEELIKEKKENALIYCLLCNKKSWVKKSRI